MPAATKINARTIWGKVVLFLKEQRHIALQIACGDIADVKVEDGVLCAVTTEKYLENILNNTQNKQIIQDALRWQGQSLQFEVQRKIKKSELQEQDIMRLKGLGLDVRIEKGEKNGKF